MENFKTPSENIKIVECDIFDSGCSVIGHQVNCKGVMGSGLAKQLRDRHLYLYEKYSHFCEQVLKGNGVNLPTSALLGNCLLFFSKEKGVYIANLFGQDDYGRSEKVYTDYKALELALHRLHCIMKTMDIKSLALPYGLGCGLANGDWNVVFNIIGLVFANSDIEVVICKK